MKSLFLSVVAVAALVVLAAGCAGGPSGVDYAPEISPTNFVEGIDNPFFPLEPGLTFVYTGVNEEGDSQRGEIHVTGDTRLVMGVRCTVVRHMEYVNQQLVEDTHDWFAQDREGNVWYFGEDVKDYKDGVYIGGAGAWEAGIDGAQPGIIMPAKQVEGEEYRQEYYQGVAEDMAKTDRLAMAVDVPFGSYTDVLRVFEWTPLEPGSTGYAHYAKGVGLIYETERGSKERMELVEIRRAQ